MLLFMYHHTILLTRMCMCDVYISYFQQVLRNLLKQLIEY